MRTDERREKIIEMLKESDTPIPAKTLSAQFNVSRQVIVQDMAVIRASIPDIIPTNRGYIMQQQSSGFTREFKVQHNEERTEEELCLIVDCGGTVKNVSISHRVYGRITAELDISSRQDVYEFMEAINNSSSGLIGNATSGFHYHLVEAPSVERLDLIEQKLKDAGLLAELLPWEQE